MLYAFAHSCDDELISSIASVCWLSYPFFCVTLCNFSLPRFLTIIASRIKAGKKKAARWGLRFGNHQSIRTFHTKVPRSRDGNVTPLVHHLFLHESIDKSRNSDGVTNSAYMNGCIYNPPTIRLIKEPDFCQKWLPFPAFSVYSYWYSKETGIFCVNFLSSKHQLHCFRIDVNRRFSSAALYPLTRVHWCVIHGTAWSTIAGLPSSPEFSGVESPPLTWYAARRSTTDIHAHRT